MGRASQPVSLLEFKGKKHLTKKEIEERKAREIKAASDKVKPPKYLTPDLKREFKKIANELVQIGIMTNLDNDALARFLLAQKMYLKVTDQLLARDPIEIIIKTKKDDDGNIIDTREIEVTNDLFADLLMSQDKLFKQCRNAASDLGLTISSRCRLVAPKSDKSPSKTPEEEMFGDV
ncbi:phage terminase small subunit P27 family [Peribacillus castrilensis]|uniref:phage terminase small subunit P27 family n=1 Tax=Peribacillus castrilensis TaxID=2897690 RepID=UPI003D2E4C86